MQIKKYTAPTLKEATVKMKEELGDDAIILGSRLIEGDIKFGRKKMFEITVGYDESVVEVINEFSNNLKTGVEKNFSDEIALLNEKIYSNQQKNKSNPEVKNQNQRERKLEFSIEEELRDIKDLLAHREISRPLISVILQQLEQYKNFLHSSNIDSYILSSIASMVPTHNFELHKKKKSKIVSVVGPTGVGKTTCIAKLSVIAKILHNLDVGLISIDTYRLGAIDQLRIFSEISNIDMLIAYEPEEMTELVNSLKHKDIIFIDTAGRSQKNSNHLNKTKKYLDAIETDETFLVLSATNSTKNLFDTAEKFKMFDYNSFIFTKIDEGVAFGNILNVLTNFNLPVTFLSNGQVIPDDIISADSDFISSLIYSGKIEK